MSAVFLANLHHAYASTDGSYAFPNSREGDMLKTAKREIEQLEHELTTALAARKEAQDHQLRLAAELVEARKDKADLDFLLMCIATDEIRCQRGNGEFLTILRGMDGFRSAIRAARQSPESGAKGAAG